MLKEGQVVIFEVRDGETVACVLENKEDKESVRELPVPPHLAQELEAFLEGIAPEFHHIPLDEAPDCMFRAIKKGSGH